MNLLIYPGIHCPTLTKTFYNHLQAALPIPIQNCWIVPAGMGVLCGLQGLTTVLADSPSPPPDNISRLAAIGPLSVIAFSGGVVGASQMIPRWQMLGGTINCLIALDGWGVPLYGSFPIVRLSHDWFTCWSSGYLSESHTQHFYAEPTVEHLHLWEQAHTVRGWSLRQSDFHPIAPCQTNHQSRNKTSRNKTSPPNRPQQTALEIICQTLMTTWDKDIGKTP